MHSVSDSLPKTAYVKLVDIWLIFAQLVPWIEVLYIQGGFFNWSALKMTKCQFTCKSLQKSSKCQNFLRVWHLVIFRADQLKKPPCMNINLGKY